MLATTALIFACSLNLDQIYMIQNAFFILKGAISIWPIFCSFLIQNIMPVNWKKMFA